MAGDSERDVDLVTVAAFPDVAEAQLARERLETEGIRAFVIDAQTAGVLPFLTPASGGVRVQVAPADEQRAREVLGS
jgi:Putative prokaryotic signal transducing protein/SPOR domain